MIDLDRTGDVYVLRMTDGENRFNTTFLGAVHDALDEVEKSEGPAALVTTGEGKFYSNGLDLAWMGGDGAEHAGAMIQELYRLFARIMTFPMATAAAVNGHAFAGGGMLALAHDYRIMRADRGFFCLPEIDLGLPLSAQMTALIQARLAAAAAHDAIVSGRRFGGDDCVTLGFAHETRPEAEVLTAAIARVEPLAGKDRTTMRALKRGLDAAALSVIEANG